mgnify:CR=1 FL=1
MFKKVIKLNIVIVILFIFNISAFSQSNVALEIQLLTHDLIGEATIDNEIFIEWLKKINKEIEEHLKQEAGDKEVLVMITLFKERNAEITIHSRPELNNKSADILLSKLLKIKSPRTKNAKYSLAVIAKINKGSNQQIDFTPKIVHPFDREMIIFEKLSLSDKSNELEKWTENEIIPLLAFYEINVDPQFEGVLSIGKILEKKKYINEDVEKITDMNSDYWRAIMEMAKGNQLILFTKMCLHIVNREFDKAIRLLFIIHLFSDEETLPAILYEEMSLKLFILNEELNKSIKEGIKLHDEGKYDKAIAHYEYLLKIFPKSAWLNYELYYSKTASMKSIEEKEREWEKSKKIIYSCDPLYSMNVIAKTGKEGYLLFIRQEILTLFKSKNVTKKEIIKYADIAFDLENYGFAAQLYWIILSYFSEVDYGKRNILAYYLYCLDKLGDKKTIKNFKGDFKTEFQIIEKERKKLMEESTIYNAFKEKE